ncbi:TRAP-type C4-dicarboxylate transport system, small permease component [Roseovarius marisflavi]|uniref:TRAP-type C4-dicarboxylate transport system, small permease component n=1 Tax=Roseovarius marisflavi TaxID=1054996 RepID=A0A1M7DPS3_9RHOB|nr:TRAP-type C4-dicarboxylate transport system, small permease component [Roseovarius marisflavi]
MTSSQRLLRVLTRLEASLAVLACSTLVLVLVVDIIAVDVFSTVVRGSPQMEVLSGIVACMLGLTLATGSGVHFRPTFADNIIPHVLVDKVGDAISAALFGVFAVFAVEFVIQSYVYADRVPVLNAPLWLVQIVVPYVLASCALKHAVFAVSPKTKEALSG